MAGKNKLQKNVEEVTKIMIENLEKVEEREEKLEDLEERADRLKESGKVFERRTEHLTKQKTGKRSAKTKGSIMAVLGIVIIVLVGLGVFFGWWVH